MSDKSILIRICKRNGFTETENEFVKSKEYRLTKNELWIGNNMSLYNCCFKYIFNPDGFVIDFGIVRNRKIKLKVVG